jgi:hypothetical protein
MEISLNSPGEIMKKHENLIKQIQVNSAEVWTHCLPNASPEHHLYVNLLDNTRAVWKVRGIALLLGVRTLWRCGDGLFFEVPPLASDALLTMFHSLLEDVLQTFCRKRHEGSGTGGFDLLNIFHVRFSVSKALPPLENRRSSHCIVSIGFTDEL